MSQLVTGDAVVLGLQPARVPSRALGAALDWAVFLGVLFLLSVVVTSVALPLGAAATAAVQVGLVVLVLIGGPIAVETLTRGRSLGKLACGLRVVRTDGGPVRFRHALVRGVIGVIEILGTVGSVACLASLISAEGRRLGDVFAGTLVVRERIPGGRSGQPLPPPPPWLAQEFAGLDLSRVPDGLWLAVRQYLGRAGNLDPQVAWSMAVRLADDVVERVGTPPPQGIGPGTYLGAVTAERQRRDAERTFGAPGSGAGPGAPPPHTSRAPYPPQVPLSPPVSPSPGAPPAEPPRAGGFTPPS